jgi:KTSC domain
MADVGERLMKMVRVLNSSAVRSVGYDAASRLLKITFVQGHTYDFCGVPLHIYGGLLAARSKGTYYNEKIRDRFPC